MAPRAGAPEPGEEGQGEGQQDGTLDDRVSSLEAGQESLAGKVDKVIEILSGKKGGGHDPEPTGDDGQGGNHPSIAHQIRAQLDERDRTDKARKDQDARDGELKALRDQVAKLTETDPAPPPRRVEKLMGWS